MYGSIYTLTFMHAMCNNVNPLLSVSFKNPVPTTSAAENTIIQVNSETMNRKTTCAKTKKQQASFTFP